MTAVMPRSFSQANNRRSSARSTPALLESGKERLDGVEHDAARANAAQRVVQANEEPLEVVFARLLDFRALHSNVFERQTLALDEAGNVIAESGGVLENVFLGLFERHEDAALATRSSVNEELAARTASCRILARRRRASGVHGAGRLQ